MSLKTLLAKTSLVLTYSNEPFERIEVYCQEDRECISIPMDCLEDFIQCLRTIREDSRKTPGQRGFEKVYPGKSWRDVGLIEKERWENAFRWEK